MDKGQQLTFLVHPVYTKRHRCRATSRWP